MKVINFKVKGFMFVALLILCLAFSSTVPAYASTINEDKKIEELNEILSSINKEVESGKEVSKESIAKLESILSEVRVGKFSDESLIATRGYGQTYNLGKGWTARVDKPHGSSETKYHVHVKGKAGKKAVEAKETVKGKSSHGKGNTMKEKGVPNDIQKKVKKLKDFQKGVEDQKKLDKAKKDIKAKKLNLNKKTDIIIAIGIVVAVMGFAFFAVSSIPVWAAFLLAL